jgi:hypothetical protein
MQCAARPAVNHTRMRIRRTLLLAALATLATAGTAHADSAEVRLPDGSVVCAFYRDADTPSRVFCNWEGADDEGVQLARRGRARIVPSSGTVRDGRGPVLRFGKTKRFGPLACRALRIEMECWSTVTTHGFVVRAGKRHPDLARHCGDLVESGAGVYGVRANRVACGTARRVAGTFYEERAVPGWRCRERRLDLEAFKVRCTRGDALVRFDHGA